MKHLIHYTLGVATVSTLLATAAAADSSSSGSVDFGRFAPPASGGEFVEVNLNSTIIHLAARLTDKSEPEVAKLLAGLQQVRVNVIGLSEANRSELQERMEKIRAQLTSNAWERIVTAQKKDEDVGIYIKTRGSESIAGLVVTAINADKQVVFANIVGDIQPEQIAIIAERFDIKPLKKLRAKTKH